MKVEVAGAEDIKELFELQKIAFETEAEMMGLRDIPALLEKFEDFKADFDKWTVLVIRDENKRIIGSVRYRKVSFFVDVGRLMVHPNYRGRKISSLLMAEVEHQNENRVIELFTCAKNVPNIEIFKHWGYEILEKKMNGNMGVVYLLKDTGFRKLIARGNTAEIYEFADGSVLKLFKEGYPEMAVQHEFENARIVYELGVRTPRVREVITKRNRKGIIYDRLEGRTLLDVVSEFSADAEKNAKAMENLKKCIRDFVDFQKQFTAIKIPKDAKLMNYKDFLRIFSRDTKEFNEKIDALPEGENLLHGDYHANNIMVNREGVLYLIDMMNVCRGPKEYDIARTYFLFGDDRKLQENYLELMGMTFEQIQPYVEIIGLLRNREMGLE